MNYININTQETTIPNRIGNRDNVTWDNSRDLLVGLGWRIQPELPPVADGFERLSVQYVYGYDDSATAVYTDTLIQDRLDAELAQRLQARIDLFTPYIHMMSVYRTLLRSYFGENAEINRDITEAAVGARFLNTPLTDLTEVQHGTLLQRYFTVLSALNDGETWTLPWELLP